MTAAAASNTCSARTFHAHRAHAPASVGTARRSIRELLLPLIKMASESDVLRADSVGCWPSGEELFFLPRFVFQRTQALKPRIKVAIFAGIHGNDLGGVLGLTEFVRALNMHPAIGREYQLWLYPLCNPSGYVDGTRGLRSGQDLDRAIWKNFAEPEVQLIEKELREHRFDGIISLRGNALGKVVHGYVWGSSLTVHLLMPALAAAEEALPFDSRVQLAGFHTIQGTNLARHDGSLRAPPEQKTEPFEIVLEIPGQISARLQAEVFLVSLHAILAAYRRIFPGTGEFFAQ